MIPLTLYMRNFMCYREQTLDFRGIHLACLTGNNGHGKSAILDAVTWVLWGRSRVGARRDDELIHLGQVEMEVELEFQLLEGTPVQDGELPDNGVRYRVIRKRSKRKRGQSSLDLQGWDDVEQRFRSLTEPTIANTQARINELLRMEYDTFINSSFLLQGRADEFTIKRPAERKQVLGDILGLGIYEQYERLAKEAGQESKRRADQLVATVEQIDRELAREPEYQADVERTEAELARLHSERTTTEETYGEIRAALQEAESARQQLADLQRRLEANRSEVQRLSDEIARYQSRLQELEDALAHETHIEQGFQSYQQALTQNEAMNAKLTELVSLNQQHNELERRIGDAWHKLDKERHSATEQVRQLKEIARALEQDAEWQAVRSELSSLDNRESDRERAQDEVQALSTESAALGSENKRAEQDAAQIKEKIALLSVSTVDPLSAKSGLAQGEEEAHCPLCGQPLSADECVALIAALTDQLERARRAYAQRTAQIKAHRRQVATLKDVIDEINRDLRTRTGWQRKEAALAHVLREAQEAYEALPKSQESLRTIETQLEKDEYAPVEREALRKIEQQLGELGYDAEAHRRVQAELDELRPFENNMRILREARSGVETIRLAIIQLDQSRSKLKGRLATDLAQSKELDKVANRLPGLQRQALQARQTLEAAHAREQQASLRLGAARNKVEYCVDLRKQRVKRRKEEQKLRQEQAIYQELQRAFGRNGVQAMLIESAIPEIEQDTNRLLSRMTRGTMQVRFETQRDTKKGDTVETLDIHIADTLGMRSYETYSGGERYRINFAIRIALSKLLARRAGAQLQLLVVDEGFGTQDIEGRDGLVDAINAIKDDFACILVITHIEELKEVFNVRIEVNKTTQGSEITIT